MKKHLILFFAGVILSYGNIKAQTAPDKKEILKVTLQVNDYFMKKYADYRTPSFVKKVCFFGRTLKGETFTGPARRFSRRPFRNGSAQHRLLRPDVHCSSVQRRTYRAAPPGHRPAVPPARPVSGRLPLQ